MFTIHFPGQVWKLSKQCLLHISLGKSGKCQNNAYYTFPWTSLEIVSKQCKGTHFPGQVLKQSPLKQCLLHISLGKSGNSHNNVYYTFHWASLGIVKAMFTTHFTGQVWELSKQCLLHIYFGKSENCQNNVFYTFPWASMEVYYTFACASLEIVKTTQV